MSLKFRMLSATFSAAMSYYSWWSRQYQLMYDGRFPKDDIPRTLSPERAQQFLDVLEWKADKGKELFDAFHHPRAVTHAIRKVLNAHGLTIFDDSFASVTPGVGQPDLSMDCDDYSIWATYHIASQWKPQILTVVWESWEGHNVCLTEHDSMYQVVSNAGISPCIRNLGDVLDWTSESVGMKGKLIFRISPPERFINKKLG